MASTLSNATRSILHGTAAYKQCPEMLRGYLEQDMVTILADGLSAAEYVSSLEEYATQVKGLPHPAACYYLAESWKLQDGKLVATLGAGSQYEASVATFVAATKPVPAPKATPKAAAAPRLNIPVLTSFLVNLQAALTTLYKAGVSPGSDAEFGTVATVLENAKDLAERRIKALNAPVTPVATPVVPVAAPVPVAAAAQTVATPTAKVTPPAKQDKAALEAAEYRAVYEAAKAAGLPSGFIDLQKLCKAKGLDHKGDEKAMRLRLLGAMGVKVATPAPVASKPVETAKPAPVASKPAPAVVKTPTVVTETQTSTRELPAEDKAIAAKPAPVASNAATCKGVKADGEKCKAKANKATGFCPRHAEQVNGKPAAAAQTVKTDAPTVYPAGTLLVADGKGGVRLATEAELWAALDNMTARKAA